MRTETRIRVPHGWMTFIYNHAGLVMHPDIHDACALLDATDQAGEGLPRKHIQGIGTYYAFSSVYKCPVYYVHIKGLEELV